MSTLVRHTFKTSRLAEFCSQKELVNQTGHDVENWPLVIIKELFDNALDGCEEAGIAPVIVVTINADGITVTDNGRGIDAQTVTDILDYASRTSSREAYVSPTRGAQGNALKTIIAMPAALGDGNGRIVIESRGIAHTINFVMDRIRQEPRIELAQAESLQANGTKIAVAWPHLACKILANAWPRIVPFVSNYATLNPHLSLNIEYGREGDVGSKKWSVSATDSDWRKWRPSDPTSPHWYDVQRLVRLMGANIARAEDRREPCKTVRDFVAEFRGMARTQTRATVCESVGAARLSLDQFLGNGSDLRRSGKLLDEMKRYSAAVLPKQLGALGHRHFAARFERFGAHPGSFEYKTASLTWDGIPYLVEAAFGYCPDKEELARRRIITGINWSPAIGDPFRELGEYDESLGEILTDQRAGQEEPIVFALHISCPRIDYLDRGKSAVTLPDAIKVDVAALVVVVTKKWAKQRKAEEKDASRRVLRGEAMGGIDKKLSQIDAAAEVLEDAYMKASDDGKLPVLARQIYYAARPLMLEKTGKTEIGYGYFSQTLLIDFMADNPKLCVKWDVIWDDRGHFEEPHGGRVIGLGTLGVRGYLKANHDLKIYGAGFSDVEIKTHGANGRFGAVLFIEKEGFRDLFESVQLAERYDLAIMSSKGVSVTAARMLAEQLCSDRGIPLLTLHDFDIAGFMIGRIGEDTRRYTFKSGIAPINIGLRLDDILEMEGTDLDDMAEPVALRGEKREELENSGANEDEINFLLGEGEFEDKGPRRIELNALTSRQLVDLIERRLDDKGITKIVPKSDRLAEAFRAYSRAPKIREAIEKAIEELPDDTIEVPADLEEQVRDYLEEHPECPWEEAVAAIVEDDEDE